MTSFLNFFENLSSLEKLSWIFICLTATWLLEFSIPLVKLNYKKWKHAGVNLVFLLCSLVINVGFGFFFFQGLQFTASYQFGLLFLLEIPTWLELVISILVLDLIAQYFVHVLLHKVSFMWRFHMVHHSDTKVDATTGTRHHPGDYLMREVFALIAVILLGAPLAYYVLYKIITILFTYFTHANIRIPKIMERWLSLVFITPNMHKFHHHFERPWTDTNYGNIFSFWDRIFKTMVSDDPNKVSYGLDVLENDKDEDLKYQFGIPFNKKIKTDY